MCIRDRYHKGHVYIAIGQDPEHGEGHGNLVCINADTGKILWPRTYPVRYSISYPAGPRMTPVIESGTGSTRSVRWATCSA